MDLILLINATNENNENKTTNISASTVYNHAKNVEYFLTFSPFLKNNNVG